MQWIDSHTHLEHEYPFSVDEYITNARAAGVTGFINVATVPGKQSIVLSSAEKYPEVYFSIGIHPHEAADWSDSCIEEMHTLHGHPKCVAVGETGLDYYYSHSVRDHQLIAFERQLKLALEWNKPVIIHCRDGKNGESAEKDALPLLQAYAAKANCPPGVIHCFTGTKWFAEECLKIGFYISFSGVVTFKNAEEIREVVRLVPENRVLVETDAPYLAPVPFRGKPNQSAYVVETAKQVAKVKGLDLETFSKLTVANTKALFRF